MLVPTHRRGPQVKNMIGVWSSSSGLLIHEPEMWLRRNNLHGAMIRATTINYPLLSTNFSNDSEGNLIGGEGFFFDLLHLLEADLNFTSSFSTAIDDKFGVETINGTWNGMVGMLVRDETDVVFAALTETSRRNEVIDFSIPIFPKARCTFISRRNIGTVASISLYVKRFSVFTWVIISLMILMVATCFYTVNESGVNRFHSPSDIEPFGLLQSVGLTTMTLIQLSYNVSIKSTSAKILFISSSIFSYIIFTFFACDLIAGMTIGSEEVPISSFQDVLDRGYQVVTRLSSSSHELLKSSKENTTMHTVYYKTMHGDANNFYVNISDALVRLRTEEKTLLWATAYNILGKHDRYEALQTDDGINTQTAWGVQKDSEYR